MRKWRKSPPNNRNFIVTHLPCREPCVSNPDVFAFLIGRLSHARICFTAFVGALAVPPTLPRGICSGKPRGRSATAASG